MGENPSLPDQVECVYCGAMCDGDPPPEIQDDHGWARLADVHLPTCEWTQTRAHRLVEVKGGPK